MQGDILFLHMSKDPIRAGEIVVFNVDVSAVLWRGIVLVIIFEIYVYFIVSLLLLTFF